VHRLIPILLAADTGKKTPEEAGVFWCLKKYTQKNVDKIPAKMAGSGFPG
jgi:hypothetical protein